jgi:hypothetical protein
MGGMSRILVAGDILDIISVSFSLLVFSERSAVPGLHPPNNKPTAKPDKKNTPTDRKQDVNHG